MKWLKHWKILILLVLAVIGPGLITASLEIDAASISMQPFARAQFGLIPLLTVTAMTPAIVVARVTTVKLGAGGRT